MRAYGFSTWSVLGVVVFLLAYYACRSAGAPPALCEALMAVPAAWAAVVLWGRARACTDVERRFYSLLSAGAAVWALGQLLWTGQVLVGAHPEQGSGPIIDVCFLGFVVVLLAAVLLGSRPRLFRPDAVDRTDAAFLALGVVFVFLRLVFVPLASRPTGDVPNILLGGLCLALSAYAAARSRLADEPASRRAYGLLALFGVSYGVGSAMGNGIAAMPAPGQILDLVWFVPFFILAAAASPGRSNWRPLPSHHVVFLVGALPLLLDLVGNEIWPDLPRSTALPLLVAFAALGALTSALRVFVGEAQLSSALADEGARLEEERRTYRLANLSAVGRPLLADLRRAVTTLEQQAEAAAPALGGEAREVAVQVERTRRLLTELEAALGPGAETTLRDVDVLRLLEGTLQEAVNAGLDVRVHLHAAPALPLVKAAPDSLGAAFRELARNAARAAPGGTLDVTAAREGNQVVVRFADDGPGIAEDIRPHVFDPFFTTRPIGEGIGLGLTLVHFVARDLRGSVRLEARPGRGACFAVRLPMRERRAIVGTAARPLATAVLGTAIVAIAVSVVPDVDQAVMLARTASFLAAAGASVALLGAARRAPVPARAFLGLLAAGPAIHAAGTLTSSALLRALADLPWAVALLPGLGRSKGGSPRALRPGGMALLVAFAAAHSIFVADAVNSVPSGMITASTFLGGFLRLGLAFAAAARAERARDDNARALFERLSFVIALWAAGTTTAPYLSALAATGASRLAEPVVVLPLLLLTRLATDEARRGLGAVSTFEPPAAARDLDLRGGISPPSTVR